jgi:hypothetical protein
MQSFEKLKRINASYANGPNTIIIHAMTGVVDPVTIQSTSYCHEFDRDNTRTIGVVTMLDVAETHKREKWCRRLANTFEPNESILQLPIGYYALRCVRSRAICFVTLPLVLHLSLSNRCP